MAFVSALKIGLLEERYSPQTVLHFLGITKTQTEYTCTKELMSLFLGSSVAYLSNALLTKMLPFLNYDRGT